jgi:putative ABC transport system permease protein
MPEQTVGAIHLDVLDLGIATALVLVSGLVSLSLRLGLERKLLVASLRTLVQLLMVGYILEWVFRIEHVALIFAALGIMIAVAGRAAIQRSSRTFTGAYWNAVVTLTLTGLMTTFTVTGVIIEVEPWYLPQYVIPLGGMVLGNSLTAISLSLDHLLESLDDRREQVEMELAHGATRWEAARDHVSAAVRRGMIPIINSMMVVGIVSLPGMMTGQILAGADPLDAVKYQVLVMFMLAASTALSSMIMSLLVYRRIFNDRHQLRAERISRSK